MTTQELYYKLYALADFLIKHANPCDWTDRNCHDTRRLNGERINTTACCHDCQYHTSKGCTIKSLWCKLWGCVAFSTKAPELYAKLTAIEAVARELNVPLIVRGEPKWNEKGGVCYGKRFNP